MSSWLCKLAMPLEWVGLNWLRWRCGCYQGRPSIAQGNSERRRRLLSSPWCVCVCVFTAWFTAAQLTQIYSGSWHLTIMIWQTTRPFGTWKKASQLDSDQCWCCLFFDIQACCNSYQMTHLQLCFHTNRWLFFTHLLPFKVISLCDLQLKNWSHLPVRGETQADSHYGNRPRNCISRLWWGY